MFGIEGLLLFVDTCEFTSILKLIVGILLCIGATVSYIPQFYVIFKSKTVDGLSEPSIVLLNIGNFCLTLNSIIFNWHKWSCFEKCNIWVCTGQLLPFYQILMGWLMVFVFYLIFMKYKIRNTEDKIIGVVFYLLVYIAFIAIAIIIAISEKLDNSGTSQTAFFNGFAQAMGYMSAICSAIVWLPQIYTLLKTKRTGNVSPWMFALQAPGNIIIIIFQAVLYKQPVSTWITYVVCCVEQTIILCIVVIYAIRDRRFKQKFIKIVDDESGYYEDEEDFEEMLGRYD